MKTPIKMRSIAGLTVLLLGVGGYLVVLGAALTASVIWLFSRVATALP